MLSSLKSQDTSKVFTTLASVAASAILVRTIYEAVDTYLVNEVNSSVSRLKVRKDEGRHAKHIKSYELTFKKKHEQMVLNSYLPYIMERGKAIRQESKVIKLYPVDFASEVSEYTFNFDRPITFETLAADSELKKAVLDDLNTFMNVEEYYRNSSKQWKLGYLIYGPLGTGKSSLTAAMANHLKYDIYDLDVSEFDNNPDYLERSLIPGLPSRTVVVVEDIDCTIKPQNQGLIKKVEVTLAEVSGELLKSNDAEVSLQGLIKFLHNKIVEYDKGREVEEETTVVKDLEILDVFRNVKIRWKLVFIKLDRTDFNIHYIMHHEVPSKSNLVFKDIDCDVKLLDQEYEKGPENYDEHKRMMSLFLEATDRLWLSCNNKRILIYMANNKAMLDTTLLVQHHKFFEEIEGLIEDAEVTLEEVLRQLMKSSDIVASFQDLVKFLHDKKFNLEKPETSMKTESIE
ncbi:hypothetical protein POTOM_041042 [Populus tomentosa]|uniref:ATPase AAA-type core domain-containing protein n=1 Tax=Populus tomentosa TaxID=118781 RepID=A0A8X8CHZ2_POPTO|nr:hypothetical protein POTOM_041042 [Populus tomentosa]